MNTRKHTSLYRLAFACLFTLDCALVPLYPSGIVAIIAWFLACLALAGVVAPVKSKFSTL